VIPLLISIMYGAAAWLLFAGLTPQTRPTSSSRSGGPFSRLWVGRARRDLLLFSVVSALVAGFLAELWPGWWVLSLCAAAAGGFAPSLLHARRERQLRARRRQALVEAIDQLKVSLLARSTLDEGLALLAEAGPAPVRRYFEQLVKRIPFVNFEPAVEELRAALADPLGERLCETLIAARRRGHGGVLEVLDQLAQSTRAVMRVEEEIAAQQSKNVLTANIITALPVALLLLFKIVSPEFLAFYDTLLGQFVLLGCAALTATGYYFMIRLGRLPEERRVLR
jgi:tight adherence protein B